MRVDFHMHSVLSDGTSTVAEVVSACERLLFWSLTDHDTIAGWSEISHLPGSVCGVEVTAWSAEREVHIVVLGCDPDNDGFATLLADIRAARLNRISMLHAHLVEHGASPGPIDKLPSPAGVVTRSHLAAAVVAAGHAPYMGAVFQRWLGDEHLRHLPSPDYPAPAAVAEAAQAAGGVAILAHPGHYADLGLVDRLLAEGNLDGLEVRHPNLAPGLDRALDGIAERRGCLVSCGSDWHGHPRRRPGDHRLPRERMQPLLERLTLGVDGPNA